MILTADDDVSFGEAICSLFWGSVFCLILTQFAVSVGGL